MNIDRTQYKKYAAAHAPKSPILKNASLAFLFGGIICVLGEALVNVYYYLCRLVMTDATTLSSITLIFLAALLTSLGLFDNIAKVAGAGTLVPITGFANSVAAPAIEFQKEGQVFGIGCKIFTISGPVILYGILISWILGVIYWIGTILM